MSFIGTLQRFDTLTRSQRGTKGKTTISNKSRDDIWTGDVDLFGKISARQEEQSQFKATLFLAYGSLGVIYGDIGTSVLYVFSAIFADINVNTGQDYSGLLVDIQGAISLIFWTITVIALFKYVMVVLRANDTGEGGTVALYAQLCRTMGISPFGTMKTEDHKQILLMKSAGAVTNKPKLGEFRHREKPDPKKAAREAAEAKRKLAKLGPSFIKPYEPRFGFLRMEAAYLVRAFRRTKIAQQCLLFVMAVATGLVIGDGALMPAFSVNSAISGIEKQTSDGIPMGAIVIISVTIIVLLFIGQQFGTRKIAFTFSPIIILWLLANLSIAIYNLQAYGAQDVFKGLNPACIYHFFQKHGKAAWASLGGVMLCVSGAETMFAAMGHFSQPSIAIAFGLFVYPILIITYLGQGAYLLQNPQDIDAAFWNSIPDQIFWPILVLATLAAIVASQAVITGTFSIIRQAMSLGVFPKMKIYHTDKYVEGQIFIPVINYTLMCLCVAVLAGFGGDNIKLGEAYGVAVMMVMLITTCFVTIIMLVKWELSLLFTVPFFLFYLFIEGVFLSANLNKVPIGGWFALAVAAVVTLIIAIWWAGSKARRKVLIQTSKSMLAGNMFVNIGDQNQDGQDGVAGRMPSSLRNAMHKTVQALGIAGDGMDLSISSTGYAYNSSFTNKDNLHAKVLGHVNLHVDVERFPSQPEATMAPKRPSLVRFSEDPVKKGVSSGPPVKKSNLNPAMKRASAPADTHPPPPLVHPITEGDREGRDSIPDPDSPTQDGNGADDTKGVSGGGGEGGGGGGGDDQQVVVAPSSISIDVMQPVLAAPPKPLGSLLIGAGSVSGDLLAGGGAADSPPGSPGPLGGHAPVRPPMPVPPGLTIAHSNSIPQSPPMRFSGGGRHESKLALTIRRERPLALLSGIGIYYGDSPIGVPPVLTHFLRNVDAMHEVAIFLTVRFLPMPYIKNSERLLVRAVQGVPNFYQVVSRYGYQEVVDHGRAFISQVISTIMHKLELKAGLKYRGLEDDYIHELEGDNNANDDLTTSKGGDPDEEEGRGGGGVQDKPVFGLEPVHEDVLEAEIEYARDSIVQDVSNPNLLISHFSKNAMNRIRVVVTDDPNPPQSVKDALYSAQTLIATASEQVVYYLGRAFTRSAVSRGALHSLFTGSFRAMEVLSYTDSEAWQIPLEEMVELGMVLEI